MKIVIATAVYYPMINGVAMFSHNLAVGLSKRGHEVLVICPSQNGKNHIETIDGVKTAYLKSTQIKVYPDQIHPVPEAKKHLGVKWPKLWYRHGFRISVFPELQIRQILDDFQPDVVHVQVSDPIGLSVVGYAKRHHIPVVTTEHNQPEVLTSSFKMPNAVRRPVNYLLSAYFRNRQSKSDFVTMPTEQSIRNLLAKKELGVPIAAVSNGVDLSNFRPGQAPDEIYQKYNIKKDASIVLYVGRVDPEKQVGKVLDAFNLMMKQAPTKLPETELVIVGDGVDRLRLEEKAKKLGLGKSVKFLGKVLPPDLYELYKVGTVFATASEIETQGIVLIEAAATGLPLVAVNKGAVAEVCQNDINGFLCEAGNVPEITKAMAKILIDQKLQKEFSKKSLEIASTHDLEKTLDKFINIYNHVIEQKHHAA